MAIKLNKCERLIDLFPKKKYKCKSCNEIILISRGEVRFSKRKYNGPYCPKCGKKFKEKSKKVSLKEDLNG